MNSYHLEHPKYPRDYRFEVLNGEVLVERWEGGKRVSCKNLSKQQARDLYKYLWDQHGYRVFGYSKLETV